MKNVSEKMGIKENCRALFIDAPTEATDGMDLPKLNISKNKSGEFDYIHLFVKRQVEYKEIFPKLKSQLKLNGMLWVSWPKGGGLSTDLSLPKVISIGYSFGLVESTCLSIDYVWSGLKFTHPKKSKVYKNSHADLKGRTTNR
ncbi:MAG: hypothetical protein ABI325_03730 [Ginsengibacter sp.]